MSETFLPYGRQWIHDDDIRAVVEVLQSDFLTTGPMIPKFEQALCDYTGARFASVNNSGTSALHCAYFAAGVGPGDEIITSPMTFAATANAALYLGASVKFVDTEPDTGNIDPSLIEEAITSKTKLLAPIDFTGLPADYDRINPIAKAHGIAVVADAAHSLGGIYKGRKVGTLTDMTEISLHPVKPITTAEGGAVLTDNQDFQKRASRFRTHGITRDPDELIRNEGPWYYEQHDLGFNYRLTDLQCALGISQLRNIESFVNRRRAIATRYTNAFKNVPQLMIPGCREGVESGWHLYIVRVADDPARRLPFFEKLRELKLGVQVHYIPVYWHPYYEKLGYKRGLCPIAEDYYSRSVSLPIFPKMTDDDVDSSIERVLRAVKEVL